MKLAQKLLIAQIVIPVFTLALTYPLSFTVADTKTEYPNFFISATIDYAPTSCIGTFGLGLTAFITFLVIGARYLQIDSIINQRHEELRRLNATGLKWGVNCCVFLLATISVEFHYSNGVHLFFALVFFVSGVVYCFYGMCIDKRLLEMSNEVHESMLWSDRHPVENDGEDRGILVIGGDMECDDGDIENQRGNHIHSDNESSPYQAQDPSHKSHKHASILDDNSNPSSKTFGEILARTQISSPELLRKRQISFYGALFFCLISSITFNWEKTHAISSIAEILMVIVFFNYFQSYWEAFKGLDLQVLTRLEIPI